MMCLLPTSARVDIFCTVTSVSLQYTTHTHTHLHTHLHTPTHTPQTQDTHHLRTERVYGKVNEQLDIFSVEKLLAELVSSKGTGRDRPGEGAVFVGGGQRECGSQIK